MKNILKTYPNKLQSWGISGIIVLITIMIAIPFELIFKKDISKDLSVFFSYNLAMGLSFLIIHLIRKKNTGISSYPIQLPNVKIILLSFLALLGVQIGISIPIACLIPMPDFIAKIFEETFKNMGIWSMLTIVITAPILEELIFRGIILEGLLKKYSVVTSILLSALLFGLVHLNPWQFIGAFLLGSLFGWVYWQTKSLLLTILLHFFNNGLAILTMFFFQKESKEMINMSLVETYGGITNTIIIIPIAIILCILSIMSLKKYFNNSNFI